MQITLTGHHLDITDSIRAAVEQRLQKFADHYPDLARCDVIVKLESGEQCVEINARGVNANASARDRDLYTAINQCVKKLNAVLSHKRGTATAKRHDKLELGGSPEPDNSPELDHSPEEVEGMEP